jgi:Cysteine rich repeat
MNVMFVQFIKLAMIPLAVGLPARIAFAQTDVAKAVHESLSAAVSKMQSSCGQDIKSYCSTVTPGEGRLLLCMEAHDDKLNAPCLYELHQAAQQLHTAADRMKEATKACKEDILKLCANVKPGQGRVAQCLASNKGTVSKGCAEAVENLQAAAAK